MVRAIIVDLWGTIAKSSGIRRPLVEAFPEVDTPDSLKRYERAYMLEQVPADDVSRRMLEAFSIKDTPEHRATVDRIITHALDTAEQIPGMEELLAELKERYTLGLYSNSPSIRKDMLERLGLEKYFTTIIFSCDTGYLKPAREAYEAVAEALDVPLKECVLLDDNKKNCERAEELGMQAVRFKNAEQARKELEKLGVLS